MKLPGNICSICKRPLTDPVSVRLGVGPVCRIKSKLKGFRRKQTSNLFGDGVDYSYGVTDGVLHIIDKDGAVSVTNAMEKVLTEIWEAGVDLRTLTATIYRDSLAVWDGVTYKPELDPRDHLDTEPRKTISKVNFYSINETELGPALIKAVEKCG